MKRENVHVANDVVREMSNIVVHPNPTLPYLEGIKKCNLQGVHFCSMCGNYTCTNIPLVLRRSLDGQTVSVEELYEGPEAINCKCYKSRKSRY